MFGEIKMRCKFCFCKCFIIVLCIFVLIQGLLKYTRFAYYEPVFEDRFCHLNVTLAVLKKGEHIKIRVIGINERAAFVSNDFKVAEVDWGGNVYAHRCGTAIISVKTTKKVLKCKIIVKD